MWRKIFGFGFGLLIACTGWAQTPDYSAANLRVQNLVQTQALPGAVLVIARVGEPNYAQAFGRYGIEQRVAIGSASKWLSGALIALLVSENKLRWDDPVRRWIPGAPSDKLSITLRQLLSHTSGLPSTASSCLNQSSITLEVCSNQILAMGLESPPGTQFNFGDNAMQVAGRIAEIASGQSFDQLFRSRIVEPLRLSQTDFGFTSDTPGIISVSNPRVAGGLRSSSGDLSKFLGWILARGVQNGNPLVFPGALIDEMELDQTRRVNTAFSSLTQANSLGYGISVWRNQVAADGRATRVSSSGAFGTVLMVDRAAGFAGVFLTMASLDQVEVGVRSVWDDVIAAQRSAGLNAPPLVNIDVAEGSARALAGSSLWAMSTSPATNRLTGFVGDSPSVLADPRSWLVRVGTGATGTSIRPVYGPVITPISAVSGQINGARYLSFFPIVNTAGSPPKGLIFRFHGSGGSADLANRAYDAQLLNLMSQEAGFAVISLDSVNRVDKQWNPTFSLGNPDVINVQGVIERLRSIGAIRADTPIFCEGISNGGAFCNRVSALLGFKAQSLVIASGIEAVMLQTNVPTIWSLASADTTLASSAVADAQRYAEGLRARGIAGEVNVQDPYPAFPSYFRRIPGIDENLSNQVHASLVAARVLDNQNRVVADSATLAAAQLPQAALRYSAAIMNLVKAAAAEHQYVSTSAQRVLPFFEAALETNLTGIWFNPAESGWGLTISQQGNQLFPVMFTYSAAGKPVWFFGSNISRGTDGTYSGAAFRTTGNPFNLIAGDSNFLATQAGDFHIEAMDAGRIRFRFTLDGISQTRTLESQRFGAPQVCRSVSSSRALSANRTDIFHNPVEPGYGVMLIEQGQTIFAAWYTYGADRSPTWAIGTLSRASDGSFAGTLSRPVSGVPFSQLSGAPATSFPVPTVGSANLKFIDGERLRFGYTMDGISGEKDLQRFSFNSVVSDCQ